LSTDTPAVHTDIQALANSLETVPLFPTSATTSRTGVIGESVNVSAGQTITLPSSAPKGGRIQIYSGAASGVSPVTVATSSGQVIFGLGVGSASSFKLGTPLAEVTLLWDGAEWIIVSGQQNTGWVPLTLGSGIATASGYDTPSARIEGDIVRFKGALQNTTGSQIAAGATLATVPSGAMHPSATRGLFLTTLSGFLGQSLLVVTTGGVIQSSFSVSSGSTAPINLDGATYTLT
jgi:hypothetical protein